MSRLSNALPHTASLRTSAYLFTSLPHYLTTSLPHYLTISYKLYLVRIWLWNQHVTVYVVLLIKYSVFKHHESWVVLCMNVMAPYILGAFLFSPLVRQLTFDVNINWWGLLSSALLIILTILLGETLVFTLGGQSDCVLSILHSGGRGLHASLRRLLKLYLRLLTFVFI
jgi:hypothetical protein